MSVSIEEICLVTSLVASTGSNVTSEYCLACASAFLLIAAIQPWSPCGPEKPIVTSLPGAALSPRGAGGLTVAVGGRRVRLVARAGGQHRAGADHPAHREETAPVEAGGTKVGHGCSF